LNSFSQAVLGDLIESGSDVGLESGIGGRAPVGFVGDDLHGVPSGVGLFM
jgi:hypothetical protein